MSAKSHVPISSRLNTVKQSRTTSFLRSRNPPSFFQHQIWAEKAPPTGPPQRILADLRQNVFGPADLHTGLASKVVTGWVKIRGGKIYGRPGFFIIKGRGSGLHVPFHSKGGFFPQPEMRGFFEVVAKYRTLTATDFPGCVFC